MPLRILLGDLLLEKVDAIVNSTSQHCEGGGGFDRMVHQAAGPELEDALAPYREKGLGFGETVATPGFGTGFRYIFHTFAPHWTGDDPQEKVWLGDCYRNCIALARSLGIASLAFPLIGGWYKRFPKGTALEVAVRTIQDCLRPDDGLVVELVVHDEQARAALVSLFPRLAKRITGSLGTEAEEHAGSALIGELLGHPTRKVLDHIPVAETYGGMLARLIKEKHLRNEDVQDAIAMSHQGFWKLLKGRSVPTRGSAWGIVFALRLSGSEAREMLGKAGYAVNPSSLRDVVLSGLVDYGMYDRLVIDDLLQDLDLEPLPGSVATDG